jgi:hypothetical protein
MWHPLPIDILSNIFVVVVYPDDIKYAQFLIPLTTKLPLLLPCIVVIVLLLLILETLHQTFLYELPLAVYANPCNFPQRDFLLGFPEDAYMPKRDAPRCERIIVLLRHAAAYGPDN